MSRGPGPEAGLETSNSLWGWVFLDHGVCGSCRKTLSRHCSAVAADSKHSPWRWHHGAQMWVGRNPSAVHRVAGDLALVQAHSFGDRVRQGRCADFMILGRAVEIRGQ